MSKKLLYHLNGNTDGRLKTYLDSLKDTLHIAWYPSAGIDFRPMLYLSPKYSEKNPGSIKENIFPNFFIYTDYLPYFTFFNKSIIYKDRRTVVTVEHIEALPNLRLRLDEDIVEFPEGNELTGKVLFLEIKVKSKELGELQYPLIYAFVENEAFCSKILLPSKSDISHIIHVRYGTAYGGSKSSGIWLFNVLKRLNCKVFISDGLYNLASGDVAALVKYRNLNGNKPEMEVIRTLPGKLWSKMITNITWNIVK